MTCITERLRRSAPDNAVFSHERQELLIEAASEIERLRDNLTDESAHCERLKRLLFAVRVLVESEPE